MWDIISNVSSIITCSLFILYIIGHIWKIIVTKNTRYEKFEILPFDSDNNIENEDNVIIIDGIGSEFCISSPYGIKTIEIYKISYDNSLSSIVRKNLKASHKDLNINDKLYVRCDLGEAAPTTQITIERMDYTKVTFEIYLSGKNGNIIVDKYNFHMTVKSLIYYLCA